MIEVSHVIGLSGIGGVQRNFAEYYNSQSVLRDKDIVSHKVYTTSKVDSEYKIISNTFNIKKVKNIFFLVCDIISRNKIVHFYNNLISFKLFLILFILPSNNIILHERGTIWNVTHSKKFFIRFISRKASIILANSNATKTMLINKFNISNEKIKVLHNGIETDTESVKKSFFNHPSFFKIGFIGRLDTPKGVHILIDAFRLLIDKNIELIIAGDGVLEELLRKQAYGLKKVSFIGRINNPYSFLKSIDLLVVPSIREPLGNVCLEAGLCKTPVLAANVDGIPEIIEHGITGELIYPTDKISLKIVSGSVPIPEFVVDPFNHKLVHPKQIDAGILASKIIDLISNPKILRYYADNLNYKVVNYFNIDRYVNELHKIYSDLKK